MVQPYYQNSDFQLFKLRNLQSISENVVLKKYYSKHFQRIQ